MGANSKIEWCHHTMNPWRGCAHVHTGCLNCYAERMSKRNPAVLGVWGQDGTRVVAAEKTWQEPLKWDKAAAKAGERHRVFCASLADVFELWEGPMVDSNETELCVCHGCGRWKNYVAYCPEDCHEERLPRKLKMNDCRARLFGLIDATPNLDWLILTKRPENIMKMWPSTPSPPQKLIDATYEGDKDAGRFAKYRPNVWLLASVSDQATADAMIPPLLQCRHLSPVLGLSMEPLVGPVDLRKTGKTTRGDDIDVLMGTRTTYQYKARDGDECSMGVSCKVYPPTEPIIDFVIVGGESGHGARPMNPQWAIDIRNQCQAAGVPFFFKQGSQANWIDFKNFDSFPPELQVREFPKASVT